MWMKRLAPLFAAAVITVGGAFTTATTPAQAKTHVHIHIGVGVPGPAYWGGPYYYPYYYYVPRPVIYNTYYVTPRRYHRPRWRTRCWRQRKVIRWWNGHRWKRKVVRKRVCRRVRVW